MKAGLFICDYVNQEFQKEFGDYPEMFSQLFPELEWNLYEVQKGEFPKDINECDAYFCTGSKHSVYEGMEWITDLKAIIQSISKSDRYFVGFCFGHQLLGEAMGGKVEKSPNGWCVGVHEFDLLAQMEWMQPNQNQINLLMMCQDQVVKLPKNAQVLAAAKKCPIGMFQVGERMLGIQAHPEYSKKYDQALMELRVGRMGKTVVKEGINSLKKKVQTSIIREWIYQFLKG